MARGIRVEYSGAFYHVSWNLIEERTSGNGLIYSYINGASTDEMVRRTGGTTTLWYYQDGRGNTSHLADDSGNFRERYTYDHAGRPSFFDSTSQPLNSSTFNNHFLFQGRDYSTELGLYDYRNRIYFPEWGRFLQPDPIGFNGDLANLYRYCGNNSVDRNDASGLAASGTTPTGKPTPPFLSLNGFSFDYPGIVVRAPGIDPTGNGPFALKALDWGSFNEVAWYLTGGDHQSIGTFAGLGDPGNFSLGSLPPSPTAPPTVPPVPTRTVPVPTVLPAPTTTVVTAVAATAEEIRAAYISGYLIGGAAAIIVLDLKYKQDLTISTMQPGDTVYLQTRWHLILGNLLQRDIYTEITMDANGRVQKRLVTPGGG